MSVVIIGGNECMAAKYKSICSQYNCSTKIFFKLQCELKQRIGNPDIMVLFLSTMSHEMRKCAIAATKDLQNVIIARSNSSSASALNRILEEHTK